MIRLTQHSGHIGRMHCSGGAQRFTLVELLAVIAILTLLASFLLFALFGVMQEGKFARTKAEIAKLNEIIMQQYDTYQYRPVPLAVSYGNLDTAQWNRLRGLRELMRLELPDRREDVTTLNSGLLSARPALSEAYLRKKSAGWSAANQGSECLYLILSQSNDGFSPALEAFTENEFGDTDGDGMKEILDGWGRPIEFIRWPTGYTGAGLNLLQKKDPVERHDPFDVMRVDANAYALYPLIVSGGPDRDYGLNLAQTLSYVGGTIPPNPFSDLTVGATTSSLDVDNISNHNQEQK